MGKTRGGGEERHEPGTSRATACSTKPSARGTEKAKKKSKKEELKPYSRELEGVKEKPSGAV